MGSFGVVDGLCASFDVRADTVIVARGECLEVIEAVDGDGVLGSVEADSGGVASNVAFGDVVCGFCSDEEAFAAEDGIGRECRALATG